MSYHFIKKTGTKFIVLILAMALITPAMAQQKVPDEKDEVKQETPIKEKKTSDYQTLFGDDIEYGGYGALSMGYTNVGDYNAILLGIQGAWIIGHGVGIGLAGRGFISETTSYNSDNDWSMLGGGYGGIYIEPIFLGKQPIHFTTPVIVGLGGISYSNSILNDFDYYEEAYEWDNFFVVEPGVEVEMNITRFFRIAAGASYRFTSDVELSYSSPVSSVPESVDVLDDLDGFSYKLCFKFGRF